MTQHLEGSDSDAAIDIKARSGSSESSERRCFIAAKGMAQKDIPHRSYNANVRRCLSGGNGPNNSCEGKQHKRSVAFLVASN